MIITSLLTKFRQNPTSSLWEILLTNKQTNKQTNRQTDTRRWLQYPAFRGIKTVEQTNRNTGSTKNKTKERRNALLTIKQKKWKNHYNKNSAKQMTELTTRAVDWNRSRINSFELHHGRKSKTDFRNMIHLANLMFVYRKIFKLQSNLCRTEFKRWSNRPPQHSSWENEHVLLQIKVTSKNAIHWWATNSVIRLQLSKNWQNKSLGRRLKRNKTTAINRRDRIVEMEASKFLHRKIMHNEVHFQCSSKKSRRRRKHNTKKMEKIHGNHPTNTCCDGPEENIQALKTSRKTEGRKSKNEINRTAAEDSSDDNQFYW